MVEIHNATLKVIAGGRITIPQEIRELESIKQGDFLRVTIQKIDQTVKQE
jgi:bifunctional DNA-binding transcriptional regulator/antitoxin component of YhaV-PrlF toxin-antitoxin module